MNSPFEKVRDDFEEALQNAVHFAVLARSTRDEMDAYSIEREEATITLKVPAELWDALVWAISQQVLVANDLLEKWDALPPVILSPRFSGEEKAA
jgi:hypothetical protein